MAENSKIQWTHHTFNPWRGCTKVSPGCANCYAEKMSHRNPAVLGEWGPRGHRSVAAESYWAEPFKWDRAAQRAGERHRVFCASLADVFEANHQVLEARARLFATIDRTPNLDWLLLTKRPENIAAMWHTRQEYDRNGMPWGRCVPTGQRIRRDNVWLGTSVEDQERFDERWPHLQRCRDLAPVLFFSVEPQLGPIDARPALSSSREGADWVIVGGESGPGCRPFNPAWGRMLRDQCLDAGVPFFFKQMGELVADTDTRLLTLKHKGGEWDDIPTELRVREFPAVAI